MNEVTESLIEVCTREQIVPNTKIVPSSSALSVPLAGSRLLTYPTLESIEIAFSMVSSLT